MTQAVNRGGNTALFDDWYGTGYQRVCEICKAVIRLRPHSLSGRWSAFEADGKAFHQCKGRRGHEAGT